MVENVDILSIYKEILEGKRKSFPLETWSVHNDGRDHFAKCLRYMVLEKYKWNRQQLLENFKGTLLKKWRLGGGLTTLFNGSTYDAITYCFPEYEIKPWQMVQAPHDYWTEEVLKTTLRDIFENELKWGRDDIPKNITAKVLKDYNLDKVLSKHRKISGGSGIYKLVCFVYPERNYRLYEFSKVKAWEDDDLLDSLRWLFETKLHWSLDEIEENLTLEIIYREGFENILWKRFGKNISRMVSFIYPERAWTGLKKQHSRKLTVKETKTLQEDIANNISHPTIAKKYIVSLDMVKYYANEMRKKKTIS